MTWVLIALLVLNALLSWGLWTDVLSVKERLRLMSPEIDEEARFQEEADRG